MTFFKKHVNAQGKSQRKSLSTGGRRLQLESLEQRELLSVTVGDLNAALDHGNDSNIPAFVATNDAPAASVDAATTLTSTAQTSESISLSWTPIPNANFYVLEYRLTNKTEPTGWTGWSGSLDGSAVSATVEGLQSDTAYDFQIAAFAGGSLGEWTVLENVSTKATPPTNITIANNGVTSKSVTISWDKMENASSYVVSYRNVGALQWSYDTNWKVDSSTVSTTVNPSSAVVA